MIKIIIVLGIFFFFSFVFLVIQTNTLNGDALSGYIENGKYFIKTESNYKEVSIFLWYFNCILWICSLITGVSFALGIIYFILRHGIPIIIKRSFRK
jgi:hypothetical protein